MLVLDVWVIFTLMVELHPSREVKLCLTVNMTVSVSLCSDLTWDTRLPCVHAWAMPLTPGACMLPRPPTFQPCTHCPSEVRLRHRWRDKLTNSKSDASWLEWCHHYFCPNPGLCHIHWWCVTVEAWRYRHMLVSKHYAWHTRLSCGNLCLGASGWHIFGATCAWVPQASVCVWGNLCLGAVWEMWQWISKVPHAVDENTVLIQCYNF